jgi:hypothetical protein
VTDDDAGNREFIGAYFEDDPAVDSTRRRLERVMREPPPQARATRWHWVAAFLTGGGAWALWRLWRRPPRSP